MPTDPHLHALFANAPTPDPIDVSAIVRKSRARRAPKVLGITAVSALAVGGIVVGSIQGLTPQDTSAESAPMLDSSTSAEMYSDTTNDEEIKRAPAEKLNMCGGTLAEVAPSQTGLVLSLNFPDGQVGSERIEGHVVMTNTGSESVHGSTAIAPIITLSQGGIVLWHHNGLMAQPYNPVDLEPGESVRYNAVFEPVVCGTEADLEFGSGAVLPSAPAGDYQLSAAIEFTSETADAELVTGPTQTITLN